MTKETFHTIKIMGKSYQIKCPEDQLDSLEQAASHLEDQMQSLRTQGNVLSLDKIAIITALNMTHQYLSLENKNNNNALSIQQRLHDLQTKLDAALIESEQMELEPA